MIDRAVNSKTGWQDTALLSCQPVAESYCAVASVFSQIRSWKKKAKACTVGSSMLKVNAIIRLPVTR